jgi:hypothetical protein
MALPPLTIQLDSAERDELEQLVRRLPLHQERSPLGLTRPPGGPTDDHETAL